MKYLEKTDFFDLSRQEKRRVRHGKVRDMYDLLPYLVLIATDRISAFDVVLPQCIPYKGATLNLQTEYFLKNTEDICPNWRLETPDPNVMIGKKLTPFKIEMVIRGYWTGSGWKAYKKYWESHEEGEFEICGIPIPKGIKEWYQFDVPIITPTTKADKGHDENISRKDIIAQGLATEAQYTQLEKYTLALFQRGQELAAQRGLILIDTKFEFGIDEGTGTIYLIDEVLTADSSRYVYVNGFEEAVAKGETPKALSKEFVRDWLKKHGFEGNKGQTVPIMSEEFVEEVSDLYIKLYETITGKTFVKPDVRNIEARIRKAINKVMTSIHTKEAVLDIVLNM
jgi:phosphoribosylaminoimidazole-succinocarboxamide synthase